MRYVGAARRLVHELKFGAALPVGGLLGGQLAAAVVAAGGDLPDLLVSVPLHWARVRSRGFNQAQEVARAAGRLLGRPVAPPGTAWRARATAAQSSLVGAGARRHNVAGAFGVSTAVRGMRVAIVDDVMTTGATVFELARRVRGAGAVGVEAWVCCRAGPPTRPGQDPAGWESGVEVGHR
jgi:ComF family protein